MHKPHYITSDIHLGAVPASTERAFVRFLEHAGAEAGTLLLNGDVFDFWFEYGDVVPGRHFRVLTALADVVEAGVPVTLLGGNHDAWGGRFLSEEVGLKLVDGPWHTRFAGRDALVVHGDGVGRGDLKYRALKATIRSRAATLAFRALHPQLGMKLARAVSTTEAKAHADEAARGRASHIREWATQQLRERPEIAYVVSGHAHLPELLEFEPGRWYMNAGDWISRATYLTLDAAGAPRLHDWPVQAARS